MAAPEPEVEDDDDDGADSPPKGCASAPPEADATAETTLPCVLTDPLYDAALFGCVHTSPEAEDAPPFPSPFPQHVHTDAPEDADMFPAQARKRKP